MTRTIALAVAAALVAAALGALAAVAEHGWRLPQVPSEFVVPHVECWRDACA